MKVLYFDICAIPLFLIILFICYSRKMTRGAANRLFIGVVFLSLLSTVADLCMEIPDTMVPLSEGGRIFCTVSSYMYLLLRNANNAVLLLFLLAFTKTTFLIRKNWVKVVYCLPYICVLVLLAQNPFTRTVFTVTSQAGYARGPLMMVLYGIALVYGLAGLIYCIYCRRYLPMNRWASLLSIYILAHAAVLIQFLYPHLLVEMFCTALGELLITLSIMRPDERMDSEAGMLSWASYQTDLQNIIISKEHVQIFVIQMMNSREILNYLGDHQYNKYLSEIAAELQVCYKDHQVELYFERPGTIYMIMDMDEAVSSEGSIYQDADRLMADIIERIRQHAGAGVRFEPQICLICVPDDLQKADEIISLGHIFQKSGSQRQGIFHASEIVHSQSFAIEAHIEQIIVRALKEGHIEMYYQPIYDIHSGSFPYAEALVRIIDPDYGLISPAVFIPAAEAQGFIISIGNVVLDQVFRFISEHDMDELGLSCIDINLSVAQCMEKSLPESIRFLQDKYGVDPKRIILEITETTFENISEVMLENVAELIEMGYSFALDDYGTGYSSIQRINHLPLTRIKIDKSMIEEASSENGKLILVHTVHMMQSIGKQLVAEGAETDDEVGILENIGCDYIQGFYFSRPLPEEEFVRYMKEHNS